ncbi:MAG: hypothetical protein KDC17_14040, partial [Actinobacteria bacterium]|nr:hypothetical protein [Actinomycetota bacterium]
MATLRCDWHAVNDTIMANSQLLVDDPERIAPIQATGKDQTLFNRLGQYRTQQRATTFDSPPESEGPPTVGDESVRRDNHRVDEHCSTVPVLARTSPEAPVWPVDSLRG